ncbi:MAG: hypothetical protein N3H30_01260 [Candidatus Micrarchaeota archaeon]|nr:hypothetical protein [Candidatus Micrarchaeota archaeon]
MLWLKGVIEGIPPRQITYEESKRNFYAQFLGLGYSKPFTYTMRQIETIRQYSLDDSEQSKEDIEVLRAMARIRGDKWLMERTYSREIDRDEAVSYDEMNGIADR